PAVYSLSLHDALPISQALDHLDDIVRLSDSVMVARGDLGVELAPEKVPSAAKRILRACREQGKPSIVATQMLESMIAAPTPTREIGRASCRERGSRPA